MACGSAAADCAPTYTVAQGDTLSKIAETQLGSIFDFQLIYDANRDLIGDNPNRIEIGQVLRMPCAGSLGDVDWSLMPNPETLAVLLQTHAVQILDIREPSAIQDGVIPGSIAIPYANWRGPEQDLGEPPSPERFAQLIGNSGLRLDRPTIIVHSHEHPMQTGAAAVVYWLLKSYGAEQLAILRGGFAAWERAELPVASKFLQATPYEVKVTFDWSWRADEVTVYGIATEQTPGHLLDARPHGMFERFDNLGRALATTLPTARSLPAPPLLAALRGEVNVEDGVQTVLETFRAIDADGRNGDVVTFCHVGELGALNWFYASELGGIQNVKLYPESINGWTVAGGLLFEGAN